MGPVIGAFLTGLRDGTDPRGHARPSGRVVVPPTEYDPMTAEDIGDLVEVGRSGVVTTWAWASSPLPDQPWTGPFAWALVRARRGRHRDAPRGRRRGPPTTCQRDAGDGAVGARPRSGSGACSDIECFVPEGSA